MRFLLDTNAISEPQRPRPDPAFANWFANQPLETLYLSVLTFGELSRGAVSLPPSRRRSDLEAWITEGLSVFGPRILPVDTRVALAWAQVSAAHRAARRTVNPVDELIAATALTHHLAVVTRNARDFEASGCEVAVPWG